MPNDDLFNEGDSNDHESQVDPNKNYLEELVGEGKKFRDANELARGKYEADQFIARLTQEQKALRDDLEKRQRLGDLIDRLATLQPNQPKEEELPNHGNPEPKGDTSLNPEKLEELVASMLSKREQTSARERNLNQVRDTLTQKMGSDYASKLKAKANELGVTPEFITDVAGRSPQALYRLIGLDSPAPANSGGGFTPPPSQRDGGTFTPNNADRTKSFYDKLKAENPKAYWSPKTQNQMHQDAMRLQEKFFS